MTLIPRFLFAILLLFPVTSFAQLPSQLINDFTTHSGYLIMPIGDEYLVDLDATTNLQEGDILTLIVPGEKVIHPVTKEVLGALDIPKGYLQITRVKSGYSYAKLLLSETTPNKGDKVRRYEQVPSVFVSDNSTEAAALYSQLKTGLPQLNWLDSSSATEPLLKFSLKNATLNVETPAGSVLRSYQVVDGALVAPLQITNRSSLLAAGKTPDDNRSLLNKTVNNFIESVGLGTTDKSIAPAGIIRNQDSSNKSIWFGPALAGNPIGIAVADFDGDGQQEVAIAMDNQLLISRISDGQLKELAKIEIATGLKILSLDSFDLDNNKQPELYLTAVKDLALTSLVIEFNAGAYVTSISNIPWFIRSAELPGEQRVLLGQSMSSTLPPYSGKPFVITRDGSELGKGREVELPNNLNLFNFLPFGQDGGGVLYAYLTDGDYLKVINPQGDNLWESGDYFGGSETSFYNQKAFRGDLLAPIYLPQRILRTSAGDILCVQNDGIRTMQRYRFFKDSRVVALRWNGYTMAEQWRTSAQKGYLADFALADVDNDGATELVLAMKFKHQGLLSEARSTIVVYELN